MDGNFPFGNREIWEICKLKDFNLHTEIMARMQILSTVSQQQTPLVKLSADCENSLVDRLIAMIESIPICVVHFLLVLLLG